MTIETLKSPNPRNRNGFSVIKSKFLCVSSMNTLLAILKVIDARRNVILAGGLYHRFPWRHLLPPPPTPFLCPTHVPYLDYSKRDNTPWLLSNHISESNFVIGEKTGGPNYVRVRWTLNLSVDL